MKGHQFPQKSSVFRLIIFGNIAEDLETFFILALEWIQMLPSSAVLVATHEGVRAGERCRVMASALKLVRRGRVSD